MSSRPQSQKKRKVDVRLELQKAAQDCEDEKDPEVPGAPIAM